MVGRWRITKDKCEIGIILRLPSSTWRLLWGNRHVDCGSAGPAEAPIEFAMVKRPRMEGLDYQGMTAGYIRLPYFQTPTSVARQESGPSGITV